MTTSTKKTTSSTTKKSQATTNTPPQATPKRTRTAAKTQTTPTTGSGAGGGATTGGTTGGASSGSGPTPVSQAVIASYLALILQLNGLLPVQAPLSGKQKNRSLKMRKGGEAIVPLVVALAARYNVQSSVLDPAGAVAQAAASSSIADLENQMASTTKALSDYRFSLQSAAWTTTTVLYTMLSRLAKTNPAIAAELSTISQFFRARSASVRANHPKTARGKAALAAKTAAAHPAPTTAPVAAPATTNGTMHS